ncbi:MAG: fibronectin type III domain-containing protein [Candidatus Diapherotrites archaeon]|nr:fibronectin type III domain-containing protein [Candidatus Diapherotrites archaeon]
MALMITLFAGNAFAVITCSIGSVSPSTIETGQITTVNITHDGNAIIPTLNSINCGDGSGATGTGLTCGAISCTLSCGTYNTAGSYDVNTLKLDFNSIIVDCGGTATVTVNSIDNPPTLSSVDINAAYAKNGTSLKITASGVTDTEGDTLTFGCSSSQSNLDTNNFDICEQTGITNYASVSCNFTAGNTTETKTIYCKIKEEPNGAQTATQTDTYIEDNTAPNQPTSINALAGNQKVTVSWTAPSDATGGSGIKHYTVYYSQTSGFNIQNGTMVDGNIAVGTNSKEVTGLANGTQYYFRVTSTDNVNLQSIQSDQINSTPISSGTTPSIPSIQSSTHTENGWNNSNDPIFTWDSVSDATGYSCTLDQTSDTTPDTSIDSDCDRDITYSDKSDGIWYMHVRACNGSNCSSADHYKIGIDTSAPASPDNLSLENESNGVRVRWDAPSDNASGIDYYIIYRGNNNSNDCDDSVVKEFTIEGDEEEYLDTYSLNEGQAYFYWIRAYDFAGNSGSVYPVCSNTGKQIQYQKTEGCSLSFNFNSPEEFIKAGKQDIEITLSSGQIKTGKIGVKKGSSNTEWILTNQNNKTSLIKEFDFDEEGEYTIYVNGYDSSNNYCDALMKVTVDATNPEIEWINPTTESETEEEINLKVKAEDESEIKQVTFYVKEGTDWTKITTVSNGSNNEFSYLWTATKTGEIELKAITEDKAGNTAEAIISITVKETETSVTEKTWSYSQDNVKKMLLDAGVNESIAEKAMQLINEMKPEMKIKSVKVGDFYEVLIEIVFTNESIESKDVQVIAIIPKSVAETASLIESNNYFEVIQDDPIIKFSFSGIEAGEEKKFSYTVAKNLSLTEADALIETALNDFIAPPMIVSNEVDVSTAAFNSKKGEINWILIIVIIVIILVLLFIGLGMLGVSGYMVHRYKKKGGNSMSSKGLHTAYSGKQNKGLLNTSGLFSSKQDYTEKPKTGKFSFKE